ncbi:MAG TPA: hypothetical protein VK463_04820 [Desulfomonilaceae bacterium]|nr:hypothetical protein [Desulfomonilaceae bacterium]
MTEYQIDKNLLESFSTEEIMRILRDEVEDYTPEAVGVFNEILRKRGVRTEKGPATADRQNSPETRETLHAGGVIVRHPGDAVRVLNSMLSGVLNGSMDPQVAQVAANLVMGILRAMEQEFMQGSGDEK